MIHLSTLLAESKLKLNIPSDIKKIYNNTKIPSNQKGFAEFCYGDMPSCKEGNEFQCTKNNASKSTHWK